MDYALYAFWTIPPLGMLCLVLWSGLEKFTSSDKTRRNSHESKDLLNQFWFLAGCSLLTFLVDTHVIQGGMADPFLRHPVVEAWLPRFLVRLFLYPIILYLGARIIGGTKVANLGLRNKDSRR